MKTVTNIYILNLSITDGIFLLGLPMIMTTAVMGRWTFGRLHNTTYHYVVNTSDRISLPIFEVVVFLDRDIEI